LKNLSHTSISPSNYNSPLPRYPTRAAVVQSHPSTCPTTKIPPPTLPLETVAVPSPPRPSIRSLADPTAPLEDQQPPSRVPSRQPPHKTNDDACRFRPSACPGTPPLNLHLLHLGAVEVAPRPIVPNRSMRTPSTMMTAPAVASRPDPSLAACRPVDKHSEQGRPAPAQALPVDLPLIVQLPSPTPFYPQSQRVPGTGVE
jgi:hypothetical protein